MVDSVKKLLGPLVHGVRRLRARLLVRRLIAHDDPVLSAIGRAVSETLSNSIPTDERRTLERIEQRRHDLLASDEVLVNVDYGAGSSTSSRTREQMAAGVESTVTVAEMCRFSKPVFWAVFLHRLTRHLQPMSAVELGTCVGISASYQGAAMKANWKGRLVTLEGSPAVADVARATLELIEATNVSVVIGPFRETLTGVLESAAPVDYLFNDGHHDHDAVLEYHEAAVPHLADDAVVVFDDISWSAGMRQAWNEIDNHPRVRATVDLGAIGIAVIGAPADRRESFRIVL